MPTEVVELSNVVTGGGNRRVNRRPPAGSGRQGASVHGKLANVSAIQFRNVSPAGPNRGITVTFKPVLVSGVARPSPFGSIPAPFVLQPGDSRDIPVTSAGSLDFTTVPATAAGHDHSDIHIDC